LPASAQLAFGETDGPPAWRRRRTITAISEIPARAKIAIRIGTSGEEPPSLSEAGAPTWLPCCGWAGFFPEEPLPGLPCPVPPLGAAALGLPPFAGDEPLCEPTFEGFDADPPPVGFVDEPPPFPDFVATGSWRVGSGLPVAVGTGFEYWTSLESA
jgi:hypothetical protein